MECKIKKDLFNKLTTLTNTGILTSFSVYPYHKGIDVSIETVSKDRLDYEELKELEDQIIDFFYENEIETTCTFCPKFDNDILFFDTFYEYDLKEYTDASSNWNMQNLVNYLDVEISSKFNEEVNAENVFLNLEISEVDLNLDTYSLRYFLQNDKELDITEDQSIKNSILKYVHDWAIENLIESSSNNICYSLIIEDSYLSMFKEITNGVINLKIIENN
jgi:hypothetical protein